MGMMDGIKVLDLSTLFAGPLIATLLGDHGAEVIKVEHPRGDDARRWGASKEDVSLFWKVLSRNKKCISVNLNESEGQEIIRKLIKEADVLIENFRPGRMEKWGLGWEDVSKINDRLIMVRVTGFGQTGPYSSFAGFGTLAEAMSGFAHITGETDRPPTLPPFGLADGISGITGAFAVASALYKREQAGKGECIDLALYESLMWILGGHIVEYDQLGTVQMRNGNQSLRTSPRNTYRTKDGKWIALSASSESIAARVFNAIGMPELIEDERFSTNQSRLMHRDEVDRFVGEWAMRHTQQEAMDILREADAAVAPIYDVRQIVEDEHFIHRGSIVKVPDPELGEVRMQGIFPNIMNEQGEIRWTGAHEIGTHTEEILASLGYSTNQIADMRKRKAIR